MTTLAINHLDAARLVSALAETDETGWVLGVRHVPGADLLLGFKLYDVPVTAYRERGPLRLTIASVGYVPAFTAIGREGGLPVFVHTHPGGDPRRSGLDKHVDEQLATFAAARELPAYVSLIVGGTPSAPRFTGRVFGADGQVGSIEKLRIAGPDFRILLADDHQDGGIASIFDRQARAFGPDGQRLLSTLKIGVVGAGGTGSPTVEQLARLGIGELLVIDDDTVDETNLTRIHGSTVDDIGTAKAELAAALGQSYGTGTRITAVVGSAATAAGIDALKSCDVVFGCTDDHAGRLVLSRLAYYYLLPVIDTGVVIDVVDGTIRGVNGRVTIVAPGSPCLLCRGQVDVRVASEEMMSAERRRELAGQGYARGEAGPAPAVIAFTTVTSAHAISDLLGRLFAYATSTKTQLLIRLHDQTVSRAGRASVEGHYCVSPEQWALGDRQPRLDIVGIE